MALVKAPNGDVYDLPEATASGLVNGHESEWEYAEAKPTPAKKTAARPAANDQ
ncbi:hypothetical protein [Nocardioides nitrophenolicus]|uniref:hypothetical protein n=1 Tax=Nocardioides nitrophenolicus TaxID=60489 RepID=UPI00195AD741|nr:hypothetical protein [Nocardioides nitrophenolicus]MBM7518278.1 hypothetical protein [Nocardioides nitrophenolicus]